MSYVDYRDKLTNSSEFIKHTVAIGYIYKIR